MLILFSVSMLCVGMAVQKALNIPWDKIPWDTIFAWIEKMMAKCAKEGADQSEQIAQIRNPSPRFRARLERVTHRGFLRNGGTASQWRQNKDAIMSRVYREGLNAEDSEIMTLITSARKLNVEDLVDDDFADD